MTDQLSTSTKAKPAKTLDEAFADICLMDGPLGQRLAAYTEKLQELEFPFAEAYDELVDRLIEGEVGTAAPAVGDKMPNFILPTLGGGLVSLESLIENGAVVLSFNRGHWCPFCELELRSIATHHAEIAARGGQVVSILPDSQRFLGDIRNTTENRLLILTDIDNGYALSLGLVIWVGDRIKELMKGHGLHLDEYQGNDGWFLPLPATFVIGRNGRVVARMVDPDFRKRMEIDDITAALQSPEASIPP